MYLPSTLLAHTFAIAFTFSLFSSTVLACTQCAHPGVFTGKLALFTNPSSAYCGLEDTPADAIYAAVSSKFYNPPDESPCDAMVNVTNPGRFTQVSYSVVSAFSCAFSSWAVLCCDEG